MLVPLSIDLCEVSPLLWQIVKREDGRNGTDGDAGSAIDATIRLNIELMRGNEFDLVTAGVNHIAGAGIYTRSIFHTNARFGNYVWHIVRVEPNRDHGP